MEEQVMCYKLKILSGERGQWRVQKCPQNKDTFAFENF